jgi:hypothetical protein
VDDLGPRSNNDVEGHVGVAALVLHSQESTPGLTSVAVRDTMAA